MKNNNYIISVKSIITNFIILAFLLCPTELFSLTDGILEVSGRMEKDNRPIAEGEVLVYKDNELVAKVSTNILGRFEFYLQFDNYYQVEFTAADLIVKRLDFDTRLPDDVSREDFYEFELIIELFPKIDDLDLSFFDEPLAAIRFEGDEVEDFYYPEDEYSDNLAKAAELKKLVEEIIRRDQRYDDLVSRADNMFERGEFNAALDNYIAASEIYPDREHPLKRIREIIQTLAQKEDIRGRYGQLIELADNNFHLEKYQTALEHYKSALELRPDESYPMQRIQEIGMLLAGRIPAGLTQAERDSILRVEALKDEKYDSLITLADQHFDDELLLLAKDLYSQALQVRPDKNYPEDRMLRINRFLREQRETEAHYARAIEQADSLYEDQRYQLALFKYEEALDVKPHETYPQEQVSIIEGLLAEMRSEDEEYIELISEADSYFYARNYERAKSEYEKASELRPYEDYPNMRLEEISAILSRREKDIEAYSEAIRRGDSYFDREKYIQAREAYNDALSIRPDEEYPKTRLDEIRDLLALHYSEDLAYRLNVEQGDKLFSQHRYLAARDAYHKAFNIYPDSDYPVRRIREINEIIMRGEEMEAFYNKGYMEASGLKEIIGNNTEHIYHIVPFSRYRSGSYIDMKVKNLSEQNIRLFVNYGVGQSRRGGIAVVIPRVEDYYSLKINVSSQPSWIRSDNNWISLSPVGGDIEVEYIRVVFGD